MISPKPKKPAYIIALQQFLGGATAGKRFIHDHIEQDACDVPFGRAASRLQLFHALMQVQGWHVDTQRMLYDRVYACERLALAHTCSDDALRALSVELFGQYQH